MMRYIPNDRYTIAWFKLAECVAKGEKEKAFGVYRLLMHSFDDKAYAHQLEGDLLHAFQDDRAVEKYVQAAQLYVQNNRFKEAVLVYKDLVLVAADEQYYVTRLVELYKKHPNPDLLISVLSELADFLLANDKVRGAMAVAAELELLLQNERAAEIYAKCIVALAKTGQNCDKFKENIEKALECITKKGATQQIQTLLSLLEQTNSLWHDYIRQLL